MASGSSSQPNSGSKVYDFVSDDILCSYEDYINQDGSNGTHLDSSLSNNHATDFHKSRISRSLAYPTTNVYNQLEETLNPELITTVERTLKKHSDNLMRFLEGISSRLSQLELYCYNLDKSIGEMHSDLVRDHGDANSKLKFLEKHLLEVHRSVQMLRDKQELAETQKELCKLQLVQESSSSVPEDIARFSVWNPEKRNDVGDSPNTQLALALPSPILCQHSSISQAVSQLPPYYLPSQLPDSSCLPPDAQYHGTQLAPQAAQPSQPQVNQMIHSQQYPQFQRQWHQQGSQPMPPPQHPPMLPPQQPPLLLPQQLPNQMSAPAPCSQVYPPYIANQPANTPPEAMASSRSMQGAFPGIPQPLAGQPEATPYGYGGPQPSPAHLKGDGYDIIRSHPPMSSGGTYILYDSEGGRPYHTPQLNLYSQGGYLPSNPSPPNMPPLKPSNSLMNRNQAPQQYVRGHPYNELIDKLVSIGYHSDHVLTVIQRFEESGQLVDFNGVLDRLNGQSSGSSQRN